MKRLLAVLAVLSLSALASAQSTTSLSSVARGRVAGSPGSNGPQSQAPITNPEPMTLVALAGGAALAGGLLRRRKQNQA